MSQLVTLQLVYEFTGETQEAYDELVGFLDQDEHLSVLSEADRVDDEVSRSVRIVWSVRQYVVDREKSDLTLEG